MATTIARETDKKKQPVKRTAQGVSPAVTVTAIVLAVAFVGYIGYKSLAPKQPNPVKMTPQMAWLKQKAMESGGDINRLSPEDRARLEREQGKQAATALRIMSNPNFN